MKERSFVTFRTVESTWMNLFTDKTSKPYSRVVGLQTSSGELWAADSDNGDSENHYEKQNANRQTIELNEILYVRLVSFFKRYFSVVPDEKDAYNCHRFAYWMTGKSIAQELERPPAPDASIRKRRRVNGGLPLGEHGVWILNDGEKAVHSVIGLGKDKPEYMQVIASQGYLALDGYKNLQDFLQNNFKGKVELYV